MNGESLSAAFKRWRTRRVTAGQLEAENMIDGIPYGGCNDEWNRIKASARPQDDLWIVCSPQEEWDRFMGWEGVALIRNDEIVDFFVTAQN